MASKRSRYTIMARSTGYASLTHLPVRKIVFWSASRAPASFQLTTLSFSIHHRRPSTSITYPFELTWTVLERAMFIKCVDRDGIKLLSEPICGVTENALFTQTPFPSSYINQILPVGSYPGYLSWFQVSLKSVENCGSCGESKFRPSHWLGTSLIQQQAVIN